MEFSRSEEELKITELVIHEEEDGRTFTEQYKTLTKDYYPAF